MAGINRFSQRKRNKGNRPRNSFVVIGCEGKNKTEELYFRNFGSRKCIIKFSKGNSTDSIGIVQDVIKFAKDNEVTEEDKVYAIFDTDINQNKQQQIEEAKKLANENGVEIITSTPTFELWFLLHFRFTTKEFNSNYDLKNELRKYIKDYKKKNNTYLEIKDFTEKAIENAVKLETFQLDSGKKIDNEMCNPYTGAYKVVQELIKRNNK